MAFFFRKRGPARRTMAGAPVAAISISSRPFAAAVYSSIVDVLLAPVANTEWEPQGARPGWEKMRDFLDEEGANVVARLLSNGAVHVDCVGEGRYVLPPSETATSLCFVSDDVKRYGSSTADLLRPTLDYLDAILNASHTAVSRLGVVALLAPKVGEYGNLLTDQEMADEEARLAEDYGALESQKIVKIMRRDYSAQIVNIAGADLQLSERFTQAVRIVATKIGVPFELLPVAVEGNSNQTGVYQREATLRLYQTARVWQNTLLSVAEAFGYSFEARNPYAPQTFETEKVDFAAKLSDTLAKSVENGFISREKAAEVFRGAIEL